MPKLVASLVRKGKIKKRLTRQKVLFIVDRMTPVSELELKTTYIVHALSETELRQLLADAGIVRSERDVILDLNDYLKVMGLEPVPISEYASGIYSVLSSAFMIKVKRTYKIVNDVPIYFVEEPPITEPRIIKKIYIYLRKSLTRYGEITNPKKFIDDTFKHLYGFTYDDVSYIREVSAAVYYFVRDTFGYGVFSPFMADENIEDISWYHDTFEVQVVDGLINSRVLSKLGSSIEFIPTNMAIPPSILHELEDPEVLANLTELQRKRILRNYRLMYMRDAIQSVLFKAGVGLTYAKPVVETKIYDPERECYHRVAAHLDNVSRSIGITIRKFPAIKRSITTLISNGVLAPEMAAYMILTMINRGFLLIIGGMGSGKTTLLQAVISALPVGIKVITIEDTPELSTPTHNWHALYTRRVKGHAEVEDIDEDRLLRTALRHRGRVVTLGEVRGAEMATLIQAAASGHAAICLPPDAPILVYEDCIVVRTIKDVVESIRKGKRVRVVSLSPDMRLTVREVEKGIVAETDELVEITLTDGRKILVTPDHEFVTANKGIVRASELRPGDKIPVMTGCPRHVNGAYPAHLYGFYAGYLLGAAARNGWGTAVVEGDAEFVTEMKKWLDSLSVFYRGDEDRIFVDDAEFIGKLREAVEKHPVQMPYSFAEGLYRALDSVRAKLKPSEAYPLMLVLRTIGVDSYYDYDASELVVIGRTMSTISVRAVKSVKTKKLDKPMTVYDISLKAEREDERTFVTTNFIVTKNCTFHSTDPFSVLMRLITPPINQSEESIKLITGIVKISREGPAPKVTAVYEIPEKIEMIKRRSGQRRAPIFSWSPTTGFVPRMIKPCSDGKGWCIDGRGVLEFIVKAKNYIRQIGGIAHPGEELRIVADTISLAKFLLTLTRKGVFDIRAVNAEITRYLLRYHKKNSDKIYNSILRLCRRVGIGEGASH